MLMSAPPARRRARLPVPGLAALLAAGAAVLLLAACGSTGSSNSSSSGSGSKLSAADQAGLAKAKAYLAKVEARPTKITDTMKITKPIPKGKTIDWISCGATPECTQEGAIIKQADSLLGWKTVILNNDGTPQTQKANFNQVVRTKPAAVLYSAIPAATFASEVPALKKNGTFVGACCITDAVGASTGIDYAIGIPNQVPPIAGAQAAVVAAGSADAGPSLIVNIPDFEILNDSVADYKSAMKTYCPTCTVAQLNIALSHVGTAPATVVSYLRAHPSVKWVVAATDALTIGLPAALKAAGLTDVHIVGQGATPTNLQYLHSGEQAADVAFPYYEELYAMVNAVAQHEAGMPVQASVGAPLWVLTPTNAPPTSSAAFPVVPSFQAQYKALWGLG
jgi:ABC-type sugar transport system substrate-binding protein